MTNAQRTAGRIANQKQQAGAKRKRWNEYHTDPRRSYYLFMRHVYGLSAGHAWRECKQPVRFYM